MNDFESAFARSCGAEHCVGVASGTDALELALRACGATGGKRVGLAPFVDDTVDDAVKRCVHLIGLAGTRLAGMITPAAADGVSDRRDHAALRPREGRR